jgi:lipoprotein signal peptidase
MKALRAIAGFLAGYGLSMASSIALFQLSGHDPHAVQPAWFIVVTAVYGIAFSVLAGYAGAWVGGYGAGFSVAVAIFVVSILSSLIDRNGAHWSQVVALVCMCPATVLGAKLRMRSRAQGFSL